MINLEAFLVRWLGFGGKGVLAKRSMLCTPSYRQGQRSRDRQSRKVRGRTGKNLPTPLSPRHVLTAQEHLQPFSFRESRGRYCEYNVHRGLLLPPMCMVHLSCDGLLGVMEDRGNGEKGRREGGEEHHTSPPFGASCHMNVKAPGWEKRNSAMSSKAREGPHTGCLRSRKAITAVLPGERQLWIKFIHI